MPGRSGLRALLGLCVAVGAFAEGAGDVLPVLPGGLRIDALLDSMHVESRWIAGHHVKWRTGEPDDRPEPIEENHSHCSAFVAAVATRLGVEILRPPEHSQLLLANAQCEWLEAEGLGSGWRPVATPLEAQRLANRGQLVVACYASPEAELPGHIAVVRPEALRPERVTTQGPQITQAGVENLRSAPLVEGFRHHPQAWARRAVRFYAHAVPDAPARGDP